MIFWNLIVKDSLGSFLDLFCWFIDWKLDTSVQRMESIRVLILPPIGCKSCYCIRVKTALRNILSPVQLSYNVASFPPFSPGSAPKLTLPMGSLSGLEVDLQDPVLGRGVRSVQSSRNSSPQFLLDFYAPFFPLFPSPIPSWPITEFPAAMMLIQWC